MFDPDTFIAPTIELETFKLAFLMNTNHKKIKNPTVDSSSVFKTIYSQKSPAEGHREIKFMHQSDLIKKPAAGLDS